jgi:tRNA-specific 2-thiouridylase
MKKTVLAALSGGIDSTYAAYLKKKEGNEVIGVTLDFYDKKDFSEVEKIAKFLNIEWYIADYKKEFQSSVITYFIKSYIDGKTPNPCAYCNRFAKFPYLYKEMLKNNADLIITGHYAGISIINGEKYIVSPKDIKKDQTYYLALIEKEILNIVEFPLSNYLKSELRTVAQDINLPSAKTKDSQEVCFLQGRDYREFLKSKIKKDKYTEGYFILDGLRIGKHEGIPFYTVGQRRGLGLKYHKPLYVKAIDNHNNNIFLQQDMPFASRGVKLYDCNFFNEFTEIKTVSVMLRYRMKRAKALLERLPFSRAHLLFDKPQYAATLGQVAAIYEDNILIGGGFIGEVF